MVISMFEVYVTTKVLQFALKLLSQSRLKDGDSYVLHRQMTESFTNNTMIAGPSEMINVMYSYEIN